MKKTININLGSQPFIIDEQAYEILHRYFEALRQKFTNENEQKEILSDIESRVAEVLSQRLGKTRAVVEEEDVVYIITLLGKPEDIAGETDSPTGPDTKTSTTFSTAYAGPAEKKFFRDPDNKKVGGVISGLCHYFGWGDPTWIRIVTLVLLVVSIFTSIPFFYPISIIYLILLIVVPEASSSAEKLQMRGQPVTIQNIEKEVRDAMTTAGTSVNNLIKNNSIRNNVSSTAGSLARAFAKIILVFVIMFCVLFMLFLIGVFFGFSILSSASLTEITQMVVSSRYIIMLFNIGILLTFGIPLVAIMYVSIKYLTNSNAKNPILKWTLWGGWFVGIIMLSISSWHVFKSFAATDTNIQKIQLLNPTGGTLKVQLADTMGNVLSIRNGDDEEFSSLVHIGGMTRTDYGFAFSDVKLEIAVSPDSNFYIEKVSFSRGATFADATKNIQQLHYKFSQTDSVLNLDDKFELPKEGKWRDQKVKLRVYVPEGKRITFGKNINQIETSVKGNNDFYDGMFPGKTLQVDNGKIICLNCKTKIITDEDLDIPEPPDAPDAPDTPDTTGHHAHVNINNGNTHEDLKNVSVNINQNGVSVSGKNNKDEDVKVKIDKQGIKVVTTDTNGNTKVIKK